MSGKYIDSGGIYRNAKISSDDPERKVLVRAAIEISRRQESLDLRKRKVSTWWAITSHEGLACHRKETRIF